MCGCKQENGGQGNKESCGVKHSTNTVHTSRFLSVGLHQNTCSSNKYTHEMAEQMQDFAECNDNRSKPQEVKLIKFQRISSTVIVQFW